LEEGPIERMVLSWRVVQKYGSRRVKCRRNESRRTKAVPYRCAYLPYP
jgi:hypothetical protein